MSAEAWGKGSGFIARSAVEHGDWMYCRKGGQVLRGSPRGKQGGGGCVAFNFFLYFFGSLWYRAPGLHPLSTACGACQQGGA